MARAHIYYIHPARGAGPAATLAAGTRQTKTEPMLCFPLFGTELSSLAAAARGCPCVSCNRLPAALSSFTPCLPLPLHWLAIYYLFLPSFHPVSFLTSSLSLAPATVALPLHQSTSRNCFLLEV